MGPVESKIRARLNYGVGLTQLEIFAIGGTLARGIVKRLVDEGEVIEADGRLRMATLKVTAEAHQRDLDERQARFLAKKKAEADALERARRHAAEEVERKERAQAAEREQRMLWANAGEYSNGERPVVIAERTEALRESRALLEVILCR